MPSADVSSRSAHPFAHLLVGRILIERGIARADQVTSCLQQQHAETRASGARRALGEIVVERGYARHEQIVEALSYQRQQFATLMVGPYRLVNTLGEGPSSVVYRAQAATGTGPSGRTPDVAIKILPQQHPGDVAALARFQREVQAGLSLTHAHIVRTLDFGTTRDTYYIVTELMAGGSLAARIENHGPLDETVALTMLEELLEALGYAWSKGLLHRDIKPSNILFDANGVPKLADLGLASLTSDMQRPGNRVVGMPHYIAPEQALSAPGIDVRADLYSLGATLFYALSGGPPFPETTPVEAINQHLNAAPPDISHINPQVGGRLAALVRKLMAKRPADRYASPAEAEEDVRRALAGTPTLAEQLTPERAYAPLGIQVRQNRGGDGHGAATSRTDAKVSGGKGGTTKTHGRTRHEGQGTTATTGVQLTTVPVVRAAIAPGTDRHQRARLAGVAEARIAARGAAPTRAPRRRSSGMVLLLVVLLAVLAGGVGTCAWIMLAQKRAAVPAAMPQPAKPPVLTAGSSVDLLDAIDAHRLNPDQWSKANHVLLSERGNWRFIAVPGQLPADYDLTWSFKRLYPGGTLGLEFTVNGHALCCQIGGADARIGFEQVDGKPWDSPGVSVAMPEPKGAEKHSTVVLRVRHDSVSVVCAGQTLLQIPAGGHLRVDSRWTLPPGAGVGVGVGVAQSQAAIYALSLTPYGLVQPAAAKP